jgi:hypothetical protein
MCVLSLAIRVPSVNCPGFLVSIRTADPLYILKEFLSKAY